MKFKATAQIVGIVALSLSYVAFTREGQTLASRPTDFERPTDVSGSRATAESVSCAIRAERTCELGSAPQVSVELVNRSPRVLYLVGSLDGSEEQMRYPYCYFEILGPDGQSSIKERLRCGNMNALRKADFSLVAPGGKFDPYRHIDHYGFFRADSISPASFPVEGVYRIRFHYSTNTPDIGPWLGDWPRADPIAEIAEMIRQVPKVSVASNELRVRVVRPAQSGTNRR